MATEADLQPAPAAEIGSGAAPSGRVLRTDHARGADQPLRRTAGLGDELKSQRERRGMKLEQVCESTKIRRSYLEALERHEWDALPAQVFVRGYLRTYAEYVGLDPDRLLKAYARERRIAGVEDPPEGEEHEKQATKAVLTRLARTKGVLGTMPLGSTVLRIVMILGGCGAGAIALWAALHLRGSGREARIPSDAPRHAARVAPVPPLRPDPIPEEPRGNGPRDLGGAPRALEVEPAIPAAVASQPPGTAPSPAQADSPRAEPAAQARRSSLEIADSGVGTSVVRHQLEGRANSFEAGTVVWFWTRVLGGRRGDTIQHVWLHDGRVIDVKKLRLGGSLWRTQSRHRLPEGSSGDWTVEVRDSLGNTLATAGFTCSAQQSTEHRTPGAAAPG